MHGTLAGTTQNDIIKEYLSRGTYVFPPEHSLRLTSDLIAYTVNHIPKWNPINICSYHLQEAGATPTQELAYALCTAIAVLDAVRDSGQVGAGRLRPRSSAGCRSSSTPASGSSRRCARCARSCELWDEVTRERYGVEDEKMRRFRYGVQVNSLGLTEAQPENNVQRIVLEMLGVTLSKDARARAVQLPAWNEALGLPRPWDQQWSLRLQQVLAFESDLLEYDDLFDGSHVVEAKVADLVAGRAGGDRPGPGDGRRRRGRRVRLHEAGAGLLARRAARPDRVRRGEGRRRELLRDDRAVAAHRRPRRRHPGGRPGGRAGRASRASRRGARSATRPRSTQPLDRLAEDAKSGANLMEATLAAARAGATTGEWAGSAARGVRRVPRPDRGVRRRRRGRGRRRTSTTVREEVRRTGEELGGRLRLLVGKPGLDGHSQRRRAGRGAGARRGLRGRLPGHPADARADRRRRGRRGRALRRPVDPVRVAHGAGAGGARRDAGAGHRATCPSSSAASSRAPTPTRLKELGVAAVFTPKDFGLTEIMAGILTQIRAAHDLD